MMWSPLPRVLGSLVGRTMNPGEIVGSGEGDSSSKADLNGQTACCGTLALSDLLPAGKTLCWRTKCLLQRTRALGHVVGRDHMVHARHWLGLPHFPSDLLA